MKLFTSIVIAAFVSIILVACSGENKPATNELKAALTQSMPGHVELNSFSVQASQNFGNKVEPIYGSRFKATVSAMVDLYKIDKKDKGIAFARLVTKKGKRTEIFGKITSKLYQGAWKHNIDIDGIPIHNLGIPLNQISDGRVIARGSDEEKKYYAEIKRKEIELRRNIANAEKILVGTWRDNNSLMIYKSDGSLRVKLDNGGESIQEWRVEGDLVYYTEKKYKNKNGKWKSGIYKVIGRILYIDKNRYTIKDSGVTYHAKRVK